MSEFEIREKIDGSLDYISGFFYNLGQSSQTIPLSLGLMRRRSKEDLMDEMIIEEDEEKEESIVIQNNVNFSIKFFKNKDIEYATKRISELTDQVNILQSGKKFLITFRKSQTEPSGPKRD